MRRSIFLGSLLLTSVVAGPAMATDLGYAPAPMNWGDLTVAGGWEQTIDHYNSCADLAGHFIYGEGRFGTYFGSNIQGQLDIHGSSDEMKGLGCNSSSTDNAAVFGAAGHLVYGLGPSNGVIPFEIGFMLAADNWQETQRWWTTAGEAVIPLGSRARAIVQGGWSFQRGSNDTSLDSGYVHGVLQYAFRPNLVLSGNGGFAAPDSDEGREDVWRYGAKLEYGLTNCASIFVEWQGIHRIEADNSNDITDNNRVMGGITFHINSNGNLLAVSPLHDYSWPGGVNNQFEF